MQGRHVGPGPHYCYAAPVMDDRQRQLETVCCVGFRSVGVDMSLVAHIPHWLGWTLGPTPFLDFRRFASQPKPNIYISLDNSVAGGAPQHNGTESDVILDRAAHQIRGAGKQCLLVLPHLR